MTINSIVRVSTQGVSRPYVCTGDDGHLYWCKGNHTGLRAVASEWICAKIARALDLPVPECHIATIAPTRFNAWCRSQSGDCPPLVTDANPYVFASRHVESAKDVIDVDADVQGVDGRLLSKIYFFDELIRNADRTDYNTNLLVNRGIHVIDHNNAFDRSFDSAVFAREHALRKFAARFSPLEVACLKREFRETITSRFLNNAWSEMPAAWTDLDASIFSLDEVKEVLLGGGHE